MSVEAVNSTPFHVGPFPILDIAMYGSQFLQVAGMASCAQVSKPWNTFVKFLPIWPALYADEKLPPIEGRGEETKMADYLFMTQHTCGARQAKCLGEFVAEKIPPLSNSNYQTLKNAKDVYEPELLMGKTWVIVVEPVYIFRVFDKGLLDDLVTKGDFDVNADENQNIEQNGLKVPYSLKNLKILAEHPVSKKGEGPVFNLFYAKALEQCSTISKTVKVTLMRKEVPEQSRNLSYRDQKELLKKEGHVLVSLCTRGYFDALEILNNNTCRDSGAPRWAYSRTSDEIKVGDKKYALSTGGSRPDIGVSVTCDGSFCEVHVYFGAAPAVPAEVLAIETLTIGHG